MTRKTFALLIAGDEQQDVDAALRFRRYLTDEAGYNDERIWKFVGDGDTYSVLDKIKYFFQKAKAQAPDEPVVVIYNGHGSEEGISPSSWGQNSFVSYDELGLCFEDGRVLFINDSCHSGSCIPNFSQSGILPNQGLVITSSGISEVSYGNRFGESLLEALRRNEPYQPKRIVVKEAFFEEYGVFLPIVTQHPQRLGLEIDHLLFPQ